MPNEIFISVIVPVYNSSKFLFEALDCLKKQTTHNIEFIIINDGSIDTSEKIILGFMEEDSRFVYFSKSKNSGYGDTCNLGIEKSKGKYIAIFEPDDLIPDNFYECLLNQANLLQADIIKYNGIYKFDDNGQTRLFKLINPPSTIFQKNEYPRFWRTHPCIVNGIYKKEFINKNYITFVTGAGASYQDTQFSVSLYYADPSIAIIDECKYQYRQHPTQSVSSLSPQVITVVINNWKEFFKRNIKSIEDNYWFANMQMYRQFTSLSKRMMSDNDRLNIFYSHHVRQTGIPKWQHLRWFNFSYQDIIKFYWFIFKKLYANNKSL